MAGQKRNRANVMNRWYGRDQDGLRHQTPRTPFKGEPQYTLEKLFITPFTHAYTADDMGRTGHTPIERNLTPSGIHILDAYLQALHHGHSDIADFCDSYNARTSDLDGLIFLLTGMTNQEFRNRWIVKTADLLLRYTDRPSRQSPIVAMQALAPISISSTSETRTPLLQPADMLCASQAKRVDIK